MVRKLLLCMVAFLIGMATCAATNQVGNDSCKTVNLVYGKKLKSLIDKDEIGSIKELILQGDMLTLKDYEFLNKMSALETLDISSYKDFRNDFRKQISGTEYPKWVKIQKPTNLKTIITDHGWKNPVDSKGLQEDFAFFKYLSSDIERSVEFEKWSSGIHHGQYENLLFWQVLFPGIERIYLKNVIPVKSLYATKLPDKFYVFPYEHWLVSLLHSNIVLLEKRSVDNDFKGFNLVTKDFAENEIDCNLSQAIYVDASALRLKNNPKKIFIPKNIRYINDDTVSLKTCTDIEFEEGDDTLYVASGTFSEIQGKNLTINRPVYICNYAFGCFETVTFNKVASYISKEAFREVTQSIYFKQIPKRIEKGWYQKTICKEYYVPVGCETRLIEMGIPKDNVYPVGYKPITLTIELKKPNSILSSLQIDNLKYIDSLTIVGFLYETDLKVLNECKNLRYLDLSKTIITYSPEKRAEMKANAKMWSSIFSSLGAIADAKYNDYSMSTLDHAYAKGFTKLMQNALVTKAEIGCIIPKRTLVGLRKLTTLILPERASKIEDNAITGCVSLKNVKLPKFLQYIGSGCFADCTSLENVDFPSTLNYLGCSGSYGQKGAFANSSLRKMDLSKCYFENNAYDYGKCWKYSVGSIKNLIEFKLPKGVTSVKVGGNKSAVLYVPANIKYLDAWDFDTIHFASPTPPEFRNDYGFHSVIYIPKGSTTAYYSVFGDKVTYKEE